MTPPAPGVTCIALLRGINVGGKNRLAMADLVTHFQRAGATSVRTYIQSGNVVFAAESAAAGEGIAEAVSGSLLRSSRLTIPIVTRTLTEMVAILKRSPLVKGQVPEDQRFIAFLKDNPNAAAAAALDPNRSPGDGYTLVGRDVHLKITTSAARTKLTTGYFDSVLKTTATIRNWRTVEALVGMGGEGEEVAE